MISSTPKNQDIDRGDRIRSERERLGYSLVDFADKSGVSKGSQRLYEKGSAPTSDYLVRIGDIGADIVFVLTGRHSQDIERRVGTKVRRTDGTIVATYEGPSKTDGKADPLVSDLDRAGFIRLPRYEVSASAGPGVALQAEHPIEVIAFDRQFLRDRGASPDQCTVIKARGDSMTPTIPDGSLLIVDHSQREIMNGYITVIGIGDDLLVKRIRRRLDGMVELISDNASYAPEVIGSDRLDQLRVVGRVVYFCRTP